jgi:hypothetical protein
VQTLDNALVRVEVMDHPIRIEEVPHRYSRGAGRVAISRSA